MSLPTLTSLLARLERLNESFVLDVCRRHDTNPADLRVLAVLRHTAGRTLNATDIRQSIVQTSGGITATLSRVETRGFVERIDDPTDGRGRLVALTDSGVEFHDRVFDDLVARYRLMLGDIDIDEALATVRALVEAFERFGGYVSSADWSAREPASTAV